MAQEALVIRAEEVPQQLATYGGAFGTGILLGWVSSTRPAWGTGMTLAAGAGGAIGALMTRGFLSQMLEGMGAAAMGALGASLPIILAGGAAGRRGTQERPAPKQLRSPTNVVAEAIAGQVKSAVEI